MSLGLHLCILGQKPKCQCVTSDYKISNISVKDKNKPTLVYFLSVEVKTHAEDALQSVFDEN